MADDALLKELGTTKAGHAIFAPSGSASWLNCAGSLLVNARGKDTAGYEAAEGTVAHAMAEEWAKTGKRPDHQVGKIHKAKAGGVWYEIEVTSEMLHQCEKFVDWCRELPGDHYFETKVDISELTPIPEQRGTADHFACEPGKLTITDLKYGTGVRVYAEGNTQALLYACGVFFLWDWCYGFKTITIRICHPRLDVFDVWTITREELITFMEVVKIKAREGWQENAPRTPSAKACRWCAGKITCPARVKQLDDEIDEIFDADEDLGDDVQGQPGGKTYTAEDLQDNVATLAGLGRAAQRIEQRQIKDLSTAALAYIHSYRSNFESWFRQIGEVLLDRAEKGQRIPFHKLTDGRARRRYKDAEAVLKLLQDKYGIPEDKVAPRKLLSVGKLSAAVRLATGMKPKYIDEILEPLVDKVRSKRTLVNELDERPEADDLTEYFEADEDEDED